MFILLAVVFRIPRYRILEAGGKFYPQGRCPIFGNWRYLEDSWECRVACDTLVEAQQELQHVLHPPTYHADGQAELKLHDQAVHRITGGKPPSF